MEIRRSAITLVIALVLASLALPAGARTDAAPRQDVAIARTFADPLFEAGTDEAGASSPGQRYPWRFPRSAVDRPDEVSGRQLHLVYVIPSNMPDDRFDELGALEDSARSMNAWMLEQTGDLRWRFDTYTFEWDDPATPEEDPVEIEAIDVTTILSTKPGNQLTGVGNVEDELEAHGLNDPNKRYLAYVASNYGGVCGDAWWTLSPTGGFDGRFSAVYLYSSAGCRARDFAPDAGTPSYTESIAMQEMIHNDGQVTLAAPHDCVVSPLAYGHVCTGPLWASSSLDPESKDVMFPYVGLPLSQKLLDADHLDYFRHPFPFRDLDTSPYLETAG